MSRRAAACTGVLVLNALVRRLSLDTALEGVAVYSGLTDTNTEGVWDKLRYAQAYSKEVRFLPLRHLLAWSREDKLML